ncbi:MAG: alpha/beta fold hydrolase [Caldimonas sp.]
MIVDEAPARKASGWRRPRRWLSLAVLAVALVGGCSGLQTQQRKWIFQASPAPAASAEVLARFAGELAMQDVWIEHVSPSAGRAIRLHSLWAPHDDPRAPLLLYLHGARRDVGRNAHRIERMRELGFSVLAIDYRGFGNSTDELPSEAGVVEDAAAAWRWLAGQRSGRARYLYGHSLGGAVAVQLAAQLDQQGAGERPQGVIVESTFTSIGDLFRTFRWGWLPVTPLITERFDSLAAVARIRTPLLVVHGSDDAIVPSRLGRQLYEQAAGPKRFLLIEGGSHSSAAWRGAEQYRSALRDFFGLRGGA